VRGGRSAARAALAAILIAAGCGGGADPPRRTTAAAVEARFRASDGVALAGTAAPRRESPARPR
jgi:hypothetical protein